MEGKVERLLNTQYVLSCFINFILMLVHYACLINFPVFILDILKHDASVAGLITTVYVFSAMLLRPLGAPVLKTFGKRRSAIIGCGIVFLAAVGYTWGAAMIGLLFVMRILNGFGFGLQTIALNTALVDFIPINRKGEGLGNFSMFMNIASAIAPILSLGLVKVYGYTALFQICIGLSIVAMGAAYYLKPQELVKEEMQSDDKTFALSDYFEVKALPAAVFGAFVFAFCYTVINTFFTAYARKIPAVAPYIGYFFIAISAALVLVRPFIGRIMDRKGERYVMYPAFVILAIGMFIISVLDSPAIMFGAAVCLGLGYSAIFAASQSSCIKAAAKERVAQANITFFFCFDLGFSLGAYFFGIVAQKIGFSNMYLADAALFGIGLILYYLFVGRDAGQSADNSKVSQLE